MGQQKVLSSDLNLRCYWSNTGSRSRLRQPPSFLHPLSGVLCSMNVCPALGLKWIEDHQFRPYSLRRGGATFWFSRHQSLDRILKV